MEAAVGGDRRSVTDMFRMRTYDLEVEGGFPPVIHLSCKALSLTVVDAVLLSVVFPWCTLIVLDVVCYQICEWWLSLTIRS